jgi:hypothetical protein
VTVTFLAVYIWKELPKVTVTCNKKADGFNPSANSYFELA